METTKACVQCGRLFEKRKTTSRKEWQLQKYCSPLCKNAAQRGTPTWNKGMRFPSKQQYVPCRICGKPTQHPGGIGSPLIGKVPCSNLACVATSRQIKNENISAGLKQHVKLKGRINTKSWKDISKVSPAEQMLLPWFCDLGWLAQHRVNTGVHTNKLPRQFILDFALPDAKLYVEIDGSSHRFRFKQERDARKDRMMSGLGWRGLRISSNDAFADPDITKERILTFAASPGKIRQLPH